MAKIKQGILGALSGKIGNVVGASWKGIAYLKSLPASVANPKTAGQITQRTAFTAIVLVASNQLTRIVKPLWDRFAQYESGYNAFVSANIKCFVGNVFTHFSDFVIARGKLVGFDHESFGATVGAFKIDLDWVDNTGEGDALASDVAYVTAYNETNDEWAVTGSFDQRVSLTADCSFPTALSAGDIIHVYAAFRRADGTSVSDSIYLTGSVPV